MENIDCDEILAYFEDELTPEKDSQQNYEEKNQIYPLGCENTIQTQGYDVKFPFPPYPCQQQIVEKIIEAITTKKNCIIESPTGTGKCISALAAGAAFMSGQVYNKNFNKEREMRNKCIDLLENIQPFIKDLIKFNKNMNQEGKTIKKLKDKYLEKKEENKNIIVDPSFYQLSKSELYGLLVDYEKLLHKSRDITLILQTYLKNILTDVLNENELIERLSGLKEKLDNADKKVRDQLKMMKESHCIIYAVRTSSQTDVVYKELEKMPKSFTTSYLKSRDFYCLNEAVHENHTVSGNILNLRCKN